MTNNSITRANAEALWGDLRGAFANLDAALKRIIEARAWEPLGYSSLAEAWSDRMGGVAIGTDLSRAYFIYALLDEMPASEVREIALGTNGIGPSRTEQIIEAHRRGIPAEHVSTVRRHLRRRPVAPHVIRVVLTADEYARLKATAERLDLNLSTEAEMAVRIRFAELGAEVNA